LKKIAENFPNLKKENRNPDPGGTEIPKQNQPKDVHTRTQSNLNGKKCDKKNS